MKQELFIGEIAELLGVSKDTLRIYEEQGLIARNGMKTGFGATARKNFTV